MKILAYTSPAQGHVYPLVPTLLALRSRGHQVAIRTLASEVAMLSKMGFAAAPISPQVEARAMDDWRGKNQLQQLQRALNAFVERAKHEVPDLAEAIRLTLPDVVLVDVNSWGAQAYAEASGLAWAVYAPYPLPLPSKDAPPFGLGLKLMGGPLGRLRDSALLRLSLLGWNKVLPKLNQVRATAGAPSLSSVIKLFGRAPLTLAYTAEPFEYHHADWPSSVKLVGPSNWEPKNQEIPWLKDLQQPMVLVTTSTEHQGDGRLLQVALDALANEPVTVVATSAGSDLTGIRIPPNARVESFVPHGPLLAVAACVVCHGGMGITQKALSAGVPVCAVPFGRDQPEVARRVEVARVGTRLPASRLTPTRLRAKVREAMTMRDGATRMAQAFAALHSDTTAAIALEGLLSTEVVRRPLVQEALS